MPHEPPLDRSASPRPPADTRPVYLLKLRAEPGVDPVRALRAGLKRLLRVHRLRCIGLELRDDLGDDGHPLALPEPPPPSSPRS